MNIKIVHRREALRYDVYLYNDDYSMSGHVNSDGLVIWEPYVQGTIPTAWNVFDEYVFEAFKKAMIGEAIDQDDALQDTRNVRDRLLTMIETRWNANTP